MNNFNQAFDNMMRRFGYTGRHLARVAQLSEQTISEFRNNKKPITTKNLEQLLFNDAVSDEARSYFFAQMLGSSVFINSLIMGMDLNQKSEILMAIASTMSSSSKFSDSAVKEAIGTSV